MLTAPMSLNPLLELAALTNPPELAALRNPLMVAAPMSLDHLVPAALSDLQVAAVLRSPLLLLEEPVVPKSLLEEPAAPGLQPA